MKKSMIVLLVILFVFLLSSCDSWKMSNEERDAYVVKFLTYLDHNDYGDMYYYEIIDKSENYIITDDAIITDETFIENKFRVDIWKTDEASYIKDINKDKEMYYMDGSLYIDDIFNDTQTTETQVDFLANYSDRYQSLIAILLEVLDESSYNKYVESVKGMKYPTGETLTYTFNENALKENGFLREDQTMSLTIDIDLDKNISGLRFQIRNRLDAQSISFGPLDVENGILRYFPEEIKTILSSE